MELDKVEKFLKSTCLRYERRHLNEVYNGEEIKVYRGSKVAFVVMYHQHSKGGSKGLLELIGDIAGARDGGEGPLAADQVIDRIKGYLK